MNYEPNTTHWQKGDLVIHDADNKNKSMLMEVIGYTRDGLCRTRYRNRQARMGEYRNEIKYLHDPKRFGIHANAFAAGLEA